MKLGVRTPKSEVDDEFIPVQPALVFFLFYHATYCRGCGSLALLLTTDPLVSLAVIL